MRRRIIFIVIALFLMVGTFFLARQLLGGQSSRTASGAVAVAAKDRVLVANAELPAGSVIAANSLRWQDWPANLSAGYFVQDKTNLSDFAGAVVRSRLAAGEPLTAGEVVHPGEQGFMAAVLTPGDRAVTLAVTPSTGNAGFMFPGDRVDLILSMISPSSSGSGAARHVSGTVLTNLRIVGMDQTLSDNKKAPDKATVIPTTVTLEVTPKEAEVVAVASQLGVLSLSLRSLGNAKDAGVPGAFGQTWDSDVIHVSFAAPPAITANALAPLTNVPGASAPPGIAPSAAVTSSPVNQRKVIIIRGSDVSELLIQPPRSRSGWQP